MENMLENHADLGNVIHPCSAVRMILTMVMVGLHLIRILLLLPNLHPLSQNARRL